MKQEKYFHEKLSDDLTYLKLNRIRQSYKAVIEMAAQNNLSTLEVLCALIGEEAAARQERALEARLKRAKLPKIKTLESYDFSFPNRIPKQKILRLFDCDFIKEFKNALFVGPSGVGKTHLLTALAEAAIKKGITVRFTRVVDMINDLSAAQVDGTLGRALRAYTSPMLLCMDELGYLPVDKRGADLMFQVCSARYEEGSVVITTNRPFKEWGKIFNSDNTIATAMIDRLMHHGEVVLIQGRSYRMKDKDNNTLD